MTNEEKKDIQLLLQEFSETTMKKSIQGALDDFSETRLPRQMMGLLNEFADSMLLPAIDRLIDIKLEEKLETKLEDKLESKLEEKFGGFRAEFDGKLASHRYEMKDYIDKKLASHHADIISAIRGDKTRDRDYKTQVVGVLKRNDLVSEDESLALTQLVN